jgi:hypothetical protein
MPIPLIDPREPPRRRARRRLTTLAYQTLAQLLDELVECGEPLTVSVYAPAQRPKGKGRRLVMRWMESDGPAWEPVPPKPAARNLGPTEARILKLCGTAPISGRTLARRVGKPYSSYFRGLLTRLVAEGRLKRAVSGYVAG